MDQDIVRDSEREPERDDENLTSHVKRRDPLANDRLHDVEWVERPEASRESQGTSKQTSSFRESFDFGAIKILLILVALTVGMTLVLKFLI